MISAAGGADASDNSALRYACQSTRLLAATTPLRWWQLDQYVEDWLSGNSSAGAMCGGFVYMACRIAIRAGHVFDRVMFERGVRVGVGPLLARLYDAVQRFRGGVPYPRRQGGITVGESTPHRALNLHPGEWVRVKSYDAVLATLDQRNRNRGLYFDAEMVPYCGGTYRVLKRISRIIDEETGAMREFKTPAVILDGVFCQSRYSECRLFCPRGIYSYWRETWLERLEEVADEVSGAPETAPAGRSRHMTVAQR